MKVLLRPSVYKQLASHFRIFYRSISNSNWIIFIAYAYVTMDLLIAVIFTLFPALSGASMPFDFLLRGADAAHITCWTCPGKTNNEECNNWAPDKRCPQAHTVCKTVHRFYADGAQSISVHKTCAMPDQCTPNMVGCTWSEDLQVRVSLSLSCRFFK